MSLLNFPTNPTIGQIYTLGSNSWKWTGSAWIRYDDPNKTFANVTATQMVVSASTSATSTTTGALIVTGGVGIGGDLYVGGIFYAGGQAVLTTASFAYSVNEGTDITITLSSSTGALTFSNTSTLQTVTTRGNTTTNPIKILNSTQSTSTTTGALTVNGGIGIGGNAFVGGTVNSESVSIKSASFESIRITISTNATTVIDSFPLNRYRSAKYFVQISEVVGSITEYYAYELSLIANSVGVVDMNVYGFISTNPALVGTSGDDLGDFDALVDSGDVKLTFTPDYATQKIITAARITMIV